MRDVGERAAVDERGIVLQRLHEIGLERVLQQHRHRAVHLEVRCAHRLLVARVADDDVAEAVLQVLQRSRETENRHHFRSDDDVEAVLARVAVARPAERTDDLAQRAVVHVHDALPRDAAHVDAELVAVVDVIVERRGEQVVRERDRVEVAGEMQVDVFHRHDLRVAAARRAALHAEHRPQRRLAQADHRFLADVIERVAEAHGRRRLAFARGRRTDRRHEDQLAVLAVAQAVHVIERDLRLVVAVRLQRVFRYAQPAGKFGRALHLRLLGDLDVG